MHPKHILIYIQQDATLHSLFYLETVLYVSGGTITHQQERKQLSTASGICHTVIAICRYREKVGTGLSVVESSNGSISGSLGLSTFSRVFCQDATISPKRQFRIGLSQALPYGMEVVKEPVRGRVMAVLELIQDFRLFPGYSIRTPP